MKAVAFYISDYGFGHAARSISLIREMFKLCNDDLKVTICHSFAIEFLKQSLKDLNVDFRVIETDIGYYLKNNSIYPDSEKIEIEYNKFNNSWDKILENELEFLETNNIDLVISDISPIPFIPARQLGIKSIGISNFTWYTAYQDLVSTNSLQTFKDAYESMDIFLALAGAHEPKWGLGENRQFGFFSRESNQVEVNQILDNINPNRNKKVIYFGLGMKVHSDILSKMKIWDSKNCVFIVSSNINIERENVYKIPKDYTESQNYIAASDIVISKAGWSTVSEAVIHEKPLLLLDRQELNEDRNTIKYLENLNHIKLLDWKYLLNLEIDTALVEELKSQHVGTFKNDVLPITETILEILYS